MKRKIFLSLLFILYALRSFAQESPDGYKYSLDEWRDMTFLPGSKVKITNFTEKEKSPNREKIYDYKISNRGGLSFIRMNFDKQLYGDYDTPLFFRNSANEHLFLYCEYFCKFIGKDNKVAHERALAWRLSEFSFGFFKWRETARATNEVVEGKTTYSVENLFSGKDFTGCFAMPNNGKGEKVVFDSSKDGMTQESPILGDGDVQVLILISGFINYERPHLYKDNSRPKKIKFAIHNPHNKTTITKVFDLKDTPQPQILRFDRVLRGNIITMEILEVYPGDKYNDVCISKLWERLMRKWEFTDPDRIPLEDL